MPRSTSPQVPAATYAAKVATQFMPVLLQRRPSQPFESSLQLSESLRARVNSPAFEMSAMDGFAVRLAELVPGLMCEVSATVLAAEQEPIALLPGTAVRVMTGAPVPYGADAVIPWEHTNLASQPVTSECTEVLLDAEYCAGLSSGHHIKGVGEEFRLNEELLPVGTVLTPGALALAATAGCEAEVSAWLSEFQVWQQGRRAAAPLRVGVIATGDELVPLTGERPGYGGVFESNSLMLTALFAQFGAVPEALAVGDSREAFEAALRDMSGRCDLIVTTGGVSQGAAEVVRDCLEPSRFEHPRLGSVEFVRVALQPGSPQGLGALDVMGVAHVPVPIMCLPGTPTGAFVAFHEFVAPLLRRWQAGALVHAAPQNTALFEAAAPVTVIDAVAQYDGPAFAVRQEPLQLFRGVARFHEGHLVVREVQGAHLLGVARANCLMRIEPGVDHLEPGQPVPLMWLP